MWSGSARGGLVAKRLAALKKGGLNTDIHMDNPVAVPMAVPVAVKQESISILWGKRGYEPI